MAGETQSETSYWQLTEEMNKTLNRFSKQHQDTDDIDDCTSSILHAFIAKILCSKTLLKTYPRQPIAPDEIGTLSSEEQAALYDIATHIATRIKKLIVGQGISAEEFSSLVYEGKHLNRQLLQYNEADFIAVVNREFEPVSKHFQRKEEDLKDKLENLLGTDEFLPLTTILTHLTPYTPNNNTAHVMLDFLMMALSSLDYQQPPLKTEETPETQTTHPVPELAKFLKTYHQQTA